MSKDRIIRRYDILGYEVQVDHALGHLWVAHDGAIGWDELQAIKNEVWGKQVRAIEVYPDQSKVVNSGNYRHLWRLGAGEFCPDLADSHPGDSLETRFVRAWAEAWP